MRNLENVVCNKQFKTKLSALNSNLKIQIFKIKMLESDGDVSEGDSLLGDEEDASFG